MECHIFVPEWETEVLGKHDCDHRTELIGGFHQRERTQPQPDQGQVRPPSNAAAGRVDRTDFAGFGEHQEKRHHLHHFSFPLYYFQEGPSRKPTQNLQHRNFHQWNQPQQRTHILTSSSNSKSTRKPSSTWKSSTTRSRRKSSSKRNSTRSSTWWSLSASSSLTPTLSTRKNCWYFPFDQKNIKISNKKLQRVQGKIINEQLVAVFIEVKQKI